MGFREAVIWRAFKFDVTSKIEVTLPLNTTRKNTVTWPKIILVDSGEAGVGSLVAECGRR
jgi:hypothetical protein